MLTYDDKVNLIESLRNFQRYEWDNLSDEEYLVITKAVLVISRNMRKEDI